MLVFLEGLTGYRQMNTFQVEELVSHGYVVAGIDQPAVAADVDRTDPDGLLTGRLDLHRAGLFGVSMGGIVGAEACRTDPRLRACLLLDSRMPADVVADGLTQPAMWLTRDAASTEREGWSPDDVDQHQQTMRAAFAAAHADAYLVRIPGTFHADFTDIPGVLPLARAVGLAGPIGVERAHEVINAYSRAFFDRYLGGVAAPLLDAPGDPGIRIDRRSP